MKLVRLFTIACVVAAFTTASFAGSCCSKKKDCSKDQKPNTEKKQEPKQDQQPK